MTILIPTHGSRPKLLKQALKSIAQCELPESFHELVVIENGADSGMESLVHALPGFLNGRYMHRGRGNKSYALNEALETIGDELIVFFDDDVVVEEEVLVRYAEASQKYGRGTFFGGPTRPLYEDPPPDWLRTVMPPSMSGKKLEDWDENTRFLGFNWAAFSQDLVELGGFDPTFGPGSEFNASGQEDNMQARLIAHGAKGVVVDATVWHHVPPDQCTLNTVVERTRSAGISKGLKTNALSKGFLHSLIFLLSAPFRVTKYVAEGKSYKSKIMWAALSGNARGLLYNLRDRLS
jgi:glycosyltransferase involved in cell wall biosynthesis